MGRKELFEAGRAAFVASPDDNPDCVPFYATWAGLRAAWGKGFEDQCNSAMHYAACNASHRNGDAYEVAVETILDMARRNELPRAPYVSCAWNSAPPEPTEADAVEEFRRQWRQRFPGKRVNSKEAKAAWERVADQARKIVRDRYEVDLAEYERKEARRIAADQARADELMDRVHAIAIFDNLVRDLAKEA